MSAAAIKDMLSRRPFEPFRVRLSSGDSYEVRHSEMALLLRNGMYVAIPENANEPPSDERLPDRAVWCSLLQLAAIEPMTSRSG